MKTLEDIQNTVAKENGYKSWKQIWSDDLTSSQLRDKLWPIVCHRAQKQALENAWENAKLEYDDNGYPDLMPASDLKNIIEAWGLKVSKESILSDSNIVK